VGSSERKAILDVLRAPFERDFKRSVKFDVASAVNANKA
jgi:hypothetical protein